MATENNGLQGWTVLEEYFLDDNTTTGTEKPNNVGDPDYVPPVENLDACPLPVPPVPVTIHVNITNDNSPAVPGYVGLRKNGGSEELFTFAGVSDSALGFNVGDILTAHGFHYHLAVRWPDDGNLQYKLREGGIGGTIVDSANGGSVGAADAFVRPGYTLTATEYTIEITTTSSDASLKSPAMGYELINNTAVADSLIKVSAIDTTTALYMLGENPSEIGVPASGGPKAGSYNMKNDANTQTVLVQNNSGISISATLTTVPNSGSFTQTQVIAAGASYSFVGVDKTGFRLTIN